MSIIKNYLAGMWESAMALNKKNILDLFGRNEQAELLDLGCDDGAWTLVCADSIGTNKITGIDIVEDRLAIASSKGIKTICGNLDENTHLPDAFYDLVHANQVIEHVSSVDHFASEIFRLLKPGGYAIISTENASSWCNVFACAMGWQMFSLTNLSSRRSGIGNPLALHQGETIPLGSWTHKTIFSYKGLFEFFRAHRFNAIKIRGAGYFPLSPRFGKIDPRHSHFITIKVQKPF